MVHTLITRKDICIYSVWRWNVCTLYVNKGRKCTYICVYTIWWSA